ncbi:MAG: S8 family serine peptidase [Thermoanaerobaculia bacterium]
MNPGQVIAPSRTVSTRGRRPGTRSFKGALLLALLTAVPSAAREAETRALEEGAVLSPADDQGRFVHLIEFAEPGLLRRVAKAPRERFDPESPEAVAARTEVMAEQAAHLRDMTAALGRTPEVTHYYLVTHSGLATRLTPEEAAILRRLPGVVSVERERVYEPTTYRGPTFIGADSIWDGTATPDMTATRGEDMVIAVLDTGVDSTHPSFANDAACGHGGGDPDKLISFLDCATTDLDGLCNGPAPNDLDGHGSHTASTAGGNTLDDTASPPPPVPPGFDSISGVAPCARLRTYKVCPAQCPGAQIQAGMNSVLLHGDVDVMNFSISGGTSPWNDNDRRKLDLVDAGVLVAASAGNTSATVPNPVGNVGHRGPWVMTVAASTHDGVSGLLSASGPGAPPPGTQNIGMVRGSDSPIADPLNDFPIRHFTEQDPTMEGCTTTIPPFPAGFFDGAAALIHRGTCSFTEKITNAFNAGADMVIIRNNTTVSVAMSTPDQPGIPAYSIDQIPGNELVAFVDANPSTATIDTEPKGDFLAGFSLRGPTPAPLQDLTKPDITGPGVSILAAVPVALGAYGNISGTSMSSPHLAGAATLVRAVRPDWTVSEVKSALMMTAFEDGTKENGSTPWDADDVGSGRAYLTKAALSGLVMDEIFDNYLAANPATGGDVKTLNIPAVRNMDCTPSCSWTRTVRNTVTDFPTSWTATGIAITPGFQITIEPASFSFSTDPMETQEVTITATPLTDLTGAVAFGEVVLSEVHAYSPDLHVTVAIRGMGEGGEDPDIGLDPASISATLPQGSSATDELTISNLGGADLIWSIFEDAGAPRGGEAWSDGFDTYATGSQMHGQGGWKGWANDPAAGALVSGDQAHSVPNSVEIVGASDLVREFEGIDSGQWTVTAWQFVPTDFTGLSYYIQLNNYNDAQTGLNWSTQVSFSGAASLVLNEGASGGSLPLIKGEWVELRIEIDLDADTQQFFYDNQLLFSGTWSGEVTGGGATVFDTIDLFANGASAVYYDDLSIAPTAPGACAGMSDAPWLGVSPTSGTTAPAGSSTVDVTLDATALEPGEYAANLCVESNDPDEPLIPVPVSLTVIAGGELACFVAELDGDQETPPVPTDATGHGDFSYDLDTRELTWDISHDIDLKEVTAAHIHVAPIGVPGPIVIPLDHTVNPIVGSATLTEQQESDLLSELYYVNVHTIANSGGEIRGQILHCGPEPGAFTPMALVVDPEVNASDGNGVFEPGETVDAAPSWRNDGDSAQSLAGTASAFTGPAGPVYTLVDGAADYGVVDPDATASCLDTGDCYSMSLNDPASRPATHWEATFDELASDGTAKTWTLHIGDSFTDVPRASLFYSWIETLLHNGVTGGCTGTTYCPAAANSRDQMSVFLLKALEGSGYTPPACGGVFGDVPCPSLFANWIEDLVARGITAGCGGGNYCPANPVSRDQMAVFLAKTFGLTLYGP